MPANSGSGPAAVNPLALEDERCFCVPCNLWFDTRDEIQQHYMHDEDHSTHLKGTPLYEDTVAQVTQFEIAHPASKDASEPVYAALLDQVEADYASMVRAVTRPKPTVSHVDGKSMDRLPDALVQRREEVQEQPAIRCYLCPSCDQKFENSDAADHHQHLLHCKRCKLSYVVKTRSHGNRKEMNGRHFCRRCSRGFDDWAQHQAYLQVNPNHWYCPKCGTEFKVNDQRSDCPKSAPDNSARSRFLEGQHQRIHLNKARVKRKYKPAAQEHSGVQKRPKNL